MRILADARALPLREGSVQCVVTSPPYWGLRDYGTGRWEGGDEDCNHQTGRFERGGLSAKQASNLGSAGDEARHECPRCGARRIDPQIGLESSPDAYVASLVAVFREVWRVLKDDGTLWLNLGDSYAGSGKGAWDRTDVQKEVYVPKPGGREASMPKVPEGTKPKDLIGIPWRVAFALQADGWYLRQDIIWHKPNPMPESVQDRCTKAHEYVFLLSKSQRYYWDAGAMREAALTSDPRKPYGSDGAWQMDGRDKWAKGQGQPRDNGSDVTVRNRRSVWTVNTQPYQGAHFAVMPEKLVEPCILAGSRSGDLILDPFCGSGTVMRVAYRFGRRGVGCDINPAYLNLAAERTTVTLGLPLEFSA